MRNYHQSGRVIRRAELWAGGEAKLLKSWWRCFGRAEDLCSGGAALSVICEKPHLQRDNMRKGNQPETC